jgi:hypothetical protein
MRAGRSKNTPVIEVRSSRDRAGFGPGSRTARNASRCRRTQHHCSQVSRHLGRRRLRSARHRSVQRVILQRLAVLAEMMEAKLANREQIDVGEHVLLTSIMVRVARHLPSLQNNPMRSRIPRDRRGGKRGRHWRQHLRGLAGASSGGTAINTIVSRRFRRHLLRRLGDCRRRRHRPRRPDLGRHAVRLWLPSGAQCLGARRFV